MSFIGTYARQHAANMAIMFFELQVAGRQSQEERTNKSCGIEATR